MMSWMLFSKTDLKVYHRKQVNATSNINLETSLMNVECHPCGLFEVLSRHQYDEAIDPTTFAASIGLGHRIKKLVSQKFMGMVRSVPFIFDTVATY